MESWKIYDFMKMHDYVSDTAYSFKFSASICIPVCIEIAKIAQTNSNYLKLTIIESTVHGFVVPPLLSAMPTSQVLPFIDIDRIKHDEIA